MDIAQFRKPLLYPVSSNDKVIVHHNLAYTPDRADYLQTDVYTPSGLSVGQRLPGVIFIHGGPLPTGLPLNPKDWGIFQSYGNLVASSGMIGITFNHRFTSPATLSQADEDITSAIAYVRNHADTFQLDADRLCMWAFSGGGAFLGPFLYEKPSFIRCFVAYYAILDLRHLNLATELGHDVVNRFSPVVALQSQGAGAPVLIARAGKDGPVINDSIDQFIQAAFAADQTIDLLNHPVGQHGFDVLDDHPRTREIIERTLAFINTHT